jgi:hypothetical protein
MRLNSAQMHEIMNRPADTDTIDRHTAATMLGISTRQLSRWHHSNYGPKRKPWRTRVRYSRAEVAKWVAEHDHEHRSGPDRCIDCTPVDIAGPNNSPPGPRK